MAELLKRVKQTGQIAPKPHGGGHPPSVKAQGEKLLSQVDTVVFDKTGTLTQEQLHVGKIHCCADIEESELLVYAAAAEYKQTHPIALAILAEVKQRGLNVAPVTQAKYEVGYGIKVSVEAKVILVGSVRMEMEGIFIPPEMNILQEETHEQGH